MLLPTSFCELHLVVIVGSDIRISILTRTSTIHINNTCLRSQPNMIMKLKLSIRISQETASQIRISQETAK